RREGAAVRQQVIATLGRIEDLQESGQLERLLRSGARFADKAIVLDAPSPERFPSTPRPSRCCSGRRGTTAAATASEPDGAPSQNHRFSGTLRDNQSQRFQFRAFAAFSCR
ncbi:MAG TPA: hypothetical protein VEH77_00830, partial [Roseiarcus sp.]|nr:hypothetical protein [Roseiarcus sp.]